MRYDTLRGFEKHLEESSPLKLSSLYFVLGKDSAQCDEAIELLLRTLLPSPGMREFALTLFDGAVSSEKELEDHLYSGSLFLTPRVVWIKQADKLKKSIQESLEIYIRQPERLQHLLLSAQGWQKNTHFYKACEKEGVVLDFAEPKSWEKEKLLVEWVGKQAARERKVISYQVSQLLVKSCGCDRALLTKEIEKLFCFCCEKSEITAQDVASICHRENKETVWQLGEAIFNQEAARTLHIGQSLLAEGQPLLPLLRQIRSQFQTQLQISCLLAEGKQSNDILLEFPYMKGQILDRHIGQARSWGPNALKEGLIFIDAAELRLKNSAIHERIAFELLAMQLIGTKKGHL